MIYRFEFDFVVRKIVFFQGKVGREIPPKHFILTMDTPSSPQLLTAHSIKNPQIIEKVKLHETRWLRFLQIKYQDQMGGNRVWDAVERPNVGNSGINAVVIVPLVYKSEWKEPKVVLVEQFRPPLGCAVIELPAGLVDGDETPESAGLRELKEETGYIATAKDVTIKSGPLASDPGLTASAVTTIVVKIDGDSEENQSVVQELDEGEYIIVHEIFKTELLSWLTQKNQGVWGPNWKNTDCLIDRALWAFAAGLAL